MLRKHTRFKHHLHVHTNKHIAPSPGSGRCHYHDPAMVASAYARPSGVPSAADMVSSILKKERRVQIRRSDSFSPGIHGLPTKHISITKCLHHTRINLACLEDLFSFFPKCFFSSVRVCVNPASVIHLAAGRYHTTSYRQFCSLQFSSFVYSSVVSLCQLISIPNL